MHKVRDPRVVPGLEQQGGDLATMMSLVVEQMRDGDPGGMLARLAFREGLKNWS